ncbi:Lsr2 dimerization domain-containing protein, partial [Enterococcus casseliflavus]|uniref:Lsr2 dimerization domain-containing protein n=2 Tax=Bacillati TaxID=1783272 RepID=UPI003018A885
MADKIIRQRVDDFDNSLDADHRVIFSVDSRWYRLDVTDANRDALHKALAPFVKVAEKLPS